MAIWPLLNSAEGARGVTIKNGPSRTSTQDYSDALSISKYSLNFDNDKPTGIPDMKKTLKCVKPTLSHFSIFWLLRILANINILQL